MEFSEPTWATKLHKKLTNLKTDINSLNVKYDTLLGFNNEAKGFKEQIDDNFQTMVENLEDKFRTECEIKIDNLWDEKKDSIVDKTQLEAIQKEMNDLVSKLAPKAELTKLSKLIANAPKKGIKPTILPWNYKELGLDVVKPNILKNLITLNMPVTRSGLLNIFEFDSMGFDMPAHSWIKTLMEGTTEDKQALEMCMSRLFWLLHQIATHLGYVKFLDRLHLKYEIKQIIKIGVSMKADHLKFFKSARTLYGKLNDLGRLGQLAPLLHDMLPPFFRKITFRFFDKVRKHKVWSEVDLDKIADVNEKEPKFRACPTPSAGKRHLDDEDRFSSDDDNLVSFFNNESKKPVSGSSDEDSLIDSIVVKGKTIASTSKQSTITSLLKPKKQEDPPITVDSESETDKEPVKKKIKVLAFSGKEKRARDARKEIESRIQELKATEINPPAPMVQNLDMDKLSKIMRALSKASKKV